MIQVADLNTGVVYSVVITVITEMMQRKGGFKKIGYNTDKAFWVSTNSSIFYFEKVSDQGVVKKYMVLNNSKINSFFSVFVPIGAI